MIIDRTEAADALELVAMSRMRGAELRSYAGGGETLIGWGIAWLGCNLVGQFAPAQARWAWPLGIAFAVIWSLTRSRDRADHRVLGTIAAALGFVGLNAAITHAGTSAQDAITSLFVAMSYVVLGLWIGARFTYLGLVLAACVVLGWFAFPDWLHLWLAMGGGGTLIAGGIWLRRA